MARRLELLLLLRAEPLKLEIAFLCEEVMLNLRSRAVVRELPRLYELLLVELLLFDALAQREIVQFLTVSNRETRLVSRDILL